LCSGRKLCNNNNIYHHHNYHNHTVAGQRGLPWTQVAVMGIVAQMIDAIVMTSLPLDQVRQGAVGQMM
jgi:hypothetical protein